MAEALVNGRILLDGGFVDGQAALLEDGRIAAVLPEGDARVKAAKRIDLEGGHLMPGFIDVQVNGGGGALFNDDPSIETLRTIAAAHRRFGTTSLLPTLISDDLAVVAKAIAAVRSALAQGVAGIAGIHLEGPFLNLARKGTHDGSKIRALGPGDIELLASLGAGRTVVTLAPEATTPESIRELTARGVMVCAGHTDATYAEIGAALAQGLRGFTHLFNAMSPMQHRAPGTVGAALDHAESWCGIIVDGKHVDPVVLRIALRAKRNDRFMLVTDAMPNVGSAQDHFMLQGKRITVADGALVDDAGVLSGAAIDMASAVRNSVDLLGLELAQAARMASAHPAAFLRLDAELGRIAPGYRANLVLTDARVNVRRTWIEGSPS